MHTLLFFLGAMGKSKGNGAIKKNVGTLVLPHIGSNTTIYRTLFFMRPPTAFFSPLRSN